LLFKKVNKTTIVVISAHARFISALPILLLGWVFACYGPSAFYLAVVEQNGKAEVLARSFGSSLSSSPFRGARKNSSLTSN
jgi:hypothetical protein